MKFQTTRLERNSFYRLIDKDVQIMAQCNAGEITREDAEGRLSRKY